VQALKPPPSMSHSTSVGLPPVLNSMLAPVELVGSAGPPVMSTVGSVRSTSHWWLSGVESVLAASSVARTSTVWLPSATGPRSSPVAQGL
jgi:hypothetical protein